MSLNTPQCEECRALADELAAAYAERWESMDERLRDTYFATLRILDDNGEEAENLRSKLRDPDVWEAAFDALPKFQPSLNSDALHGGMGPTRIGKAMEKVRMHKLRTGHTLALSPFQR